MRTRALHEPAADAVLLSVEPRLRNLVFATPNPGMPASFASLKQAHLAPVAIVLGAVHTAWMLVIGPVAALVPVTTCGTVGRVRLQRHADEQHEQGESETAHEVAFHDGNAATTSTGESSPSPKKHRHVPVCVPDLRGSAQHLVASNEAYERYGADCLSDD